MNDTNVAKIPVGHELEASQAAEVGGGGDDCGGTVDVGTDGITFSSTIDQLGSNVIRTYEGLIEATSYAIERIANSLK